MNLKELEKQVIMQTYARNNLALIRGKGARVWDEEDNEYLDFVAGIAVCNLGHANEAVADAVCKQARTLVHTSNLYYTEPQVRLARLLTEHCFADKVFFCNSGAEANEAAIKLARKYAADKYGKDRFRIITTEMSFHGRTMATLTATGQAKVKKGFDPLLGGFLTVPFSDLEAARLKMDDSVCAFLVEPIQGEGGVILPSEGYLRGLKELCRERGVLLMFDEVQTGMGRTGALFAHQVYGVEPDVMTLAKALANGLPMGAMLARDEVAQAFGPGSHATTFGGTPLVCAAAIAVLQTLTSKGFFEDLNRRSVIFEKGLLEVARSSPIVRDVRGKGMIWALDLDREAKPFVGAAQSKGVLVNSVQERTLRMTPPLTVTEAEMGRLMEVLKEILR
ncbi:MAG: aspartate aminotransferase family protein [Deltaproteobacteria bacterium]|nr:aspartate aminotransferase family protein [Deltaproteobacteria bacterium]